MKTVVAPMLFAALVCEAGQFKAGLGKGDSLKAAVPLAPEVRLLARTLSVDIQDSYPRRAARTDAISGRLRAAVESTMKPAPWQVAPTAGDTLLRVALTDFQPAQSVTRRSERVVQVPRIAPNGAVLTDPFGRPLYVNRRVVVDQWNGRGRLSFRAEAVDAKSGALIDSFTGGADFDQRADVAVNGVLQVDPAQIPDQTRIEQKLIADIAAQFAKRYNPGFEEVEIPLSVADELRAGNKLAKDGNWKAAAESWSAAVPRKVESMGDKLHNPGCLHEASAYSLLRETWGMNTAESAALLQEAQAAYEAAWKHDSKEKYYQQAIDRVRRALALTARFKSLVDSNAQALAARNAASPWPPQGPEPASKKYAVDTRSNPVAADDKESQFRELVKARFSALNGGAPPAELLTQLESLGASGYGLDAAAAKRIIGQESGPDPAKILAYQETFQALKKDGEISPEERKILDTLAANLGITPSQARLVESGAVLPATTTGK